MLADFLKINTILGDKKIFQKVEQKHGEMEIEEKQ